MLTNVETGTEAAVGYVLKRAQQELRTAMDEQLRKLGVTTPQYAVLTFLGEHPGLSAAQLARRAFVTPQTMNRIMVNLEGAGLVERAPDPEVGRVLPARLSGKGTQVLLRCHQQVREVEARMVSDLGPDDNEHLVELLQRCIDGLRPRSQ